jgi:hypothetical protein
MSNNILKLYISNFLTGLVLWDDDRESVRIRFTTTDKLKEHGATGETWEGA